MEILNELTKQVFEKYVPAARMPERNDSVYNRLKGQFELSYRHLIDTVVGDAFTAGLEAMPHAAQQVLRFTAIHAFVSQARSLDLVLTATGFGIVSTDSTAPASQSRVDSLIAQERLELITVRCIIATVLTGITGWGATRQAAACIPSLLWHATEIWPLVSLRPAADTWQTVTARINMAEDHLRRAVGDDYFEELLVKERTASLGQADTAAVRKCKAFTISFVNGYESSKGMPDWRLLDDVVAYVEEYADDIPAYKNSRIYGARHRERYENRREDPSFFFMS